MQTFKVGDKVTCVAAYGDACHVYGLTGVVVHIRGNRVGVDWRGFTGGHNCGGRSQENSGWYVNANCLKKFQPFKGNSK